MRKLQLLLCPLVATLGLSAPAMAQDDDAPPPPPPVVVAPAPNPPAPVVVNPPPAPTPPAVAVNPTTTGESDVEYHPRAGLIWGGAVVFGLSYGVTAIAAAAASDVCNSGTSTWACTPNRNDLYIPIAGPFMAMDSLHGNEVATAKTLLALDGAFQIAGVAMSLTGAILSAVPDHVHHVAPVAKRKVLLAPYATGTGMGLGAMGHF